ncbi:MAG: SHOCT domain-containing protein [Acholeplasmatales bacterium]|nr:SHOCT domain-containing protein [Acholeplasmatales bacterium]
MGDLNNEQKKINLLKECKELLDNGAITEEEFSKLKESIFSVKKPIIKNETTKTVEVETTINPKETIEEPTVIAQQAPAPIETKTPEKTIEVNDNSNLNNNDNHKDDNNKKEKKSKKKMMFFILFPLTLVVGGIIAFIVILGNKNTTNSNNNKESIESSGVPVTFNNESFGKYPQTKISDNELISNLNKKAGNLPSSENTYNWTDYNYYTDGLVDSFMYYIDIDYDNNGTNDYRGVYFTKYRSSKTNEYIDPRQEINGYTTNNIYWFRYDSIKWDVFKNYSGNNSLIVARLILDAQDIYPSDLTSNYYHNGGYGYSNNYELSNIRKWLNNDFYNVAFNSNEKKLIQTCTVNNSPSTTADASNIYACNNTTDNVFFLSYSEITTYYTTDTMCTTATDYAKCQGIMVDPDNGNSNWWGRSPKSTDAVRLLTIKRDKTITNFRVVDTSCGIRPACVVDEN